jgi:hypothetical protein
VNIVVWQAREAHRQSVEHSGFAGRYRQERDKLIRKLYATGEYSYGQLAKQVGCSVELVAKVIQGRQ